MPSLLLRIAAALCLAAALPAQAAAITLGLARSPLALPVHIAQVEGYFAAEGLQVRVLECPSGLRCLRAMLDGQADLATVADTALTFTAFERSDFAVLATVSRTRSDSKIVGRRSRGIVLPRDLVGRKVGVLAGTSAHYFLDAYLLVHGVDPAGVQTVPLQPEQTQNAITSGQVDAISVFEPYAYRAAAALGSDATVLRDDGGIYMATFNLVARRALVGVRDADLAAALRAVARAQALIRDDPAKAQALLRRWLDTDADFIAAVWPGLRFELSLDQGLLKTMESEARWALREGHVKATAMPNLLPLLHGAPLRAVDPDAVGIAR